MIDLISTVRNTRFVGDHDNGHAAIAELPKDLHDLLTAVCGLMTVVHTFGTKKEEK